MSASQSLFFSVVIPLYNRPGEIAELLDSLVKQDYERFEVIVVDDGSEPPAKQVVEGFEDRLDLRYYYIPNGGQGFARNYGFSRARGDYFIVFDSDCLVPSHYLSRVAAGLAEQDLDAFGGPDDAHDSFTTLQKAINYSMTSLLTTGGMRGNRRHLGVFHPRSFNMGLSRSAWEKTGGFRWTRQSEDLELSMRMREMGLRVGLLPDAGVFHKRRMTWKQFFRQSYSFGQGRIRLYRHFKGGLKFSHFLPALYTLGFSGLLVLTLCWFLFFPTATPQSGVLLGGICLLGWGVFSLYKLLIFLHAWYANRSLQVGMLSMLAVWVQFMAYGSGFLHDLLLKPTRHSSPAEKQS